MLLWYSRMCLYSRRETISPYKEQIYLVFVNDDKIAYNWRWEKADTRDVRLPQDHENRFGRRVL